MDKQKTIEINFAKQDQSVLDNLIAPTDLKDQTNQNFINNRFMDAFSIKMHVSVAPTYMPKNAFEQTVFYENGTTRRLYVYINGAWRYVTLT